MKKQQMNERERKKERNKMRVWEKNIASLLIVILAKSAANHLTHSASIHSIATN